MKVIAINGSPRKEWNTAMLLNACLRGAAQKGAETELVHLYDLSFRGCTSCFACKRKGVRVDRCVMQDELAPVLKRITQCDALVLGSPVYLAQVTGEMRSFMERLLFPYHSYEGKPSSFPKKINTAYLHTMNAPRFALPFIGYSRVFRQNKRSLEKVFGAPSRLLLSTSTYQFDDYSQYAMTLFSGAKRKKRRETVFPKDCEKAFRLGQSL